LTACGNTFAVLRSDDEPAAFDGWDNNDAVRLREQIPRDAFVLCTHDLVENRLGIANSLRRVVGRENNRSAHHQNYCEPGKHIDKLLSGFDFYRAISCPKS
jgi:hypothetical protein